MLVPVSKLTFASKSPRTATADVVGSWYIVNEATQATRRASQCCCCLALSSIEIHPVVVVIKFGHSSSRSRIAWFWKLVREGGQAGNKLVKAANTRAKPATQEGLSKLRNLSVCLPTSESTILGPHQLLNEAAISLRERERALDYRIVLVMPSNGRLAASKCISHH